MMKLYPSLFTYLNNCQSVSQSTVLRASDRPIIVVDSEKDLSKQPFLIRLEDKIYEIAFPYIKPTDIKHHDNRLEYIFNLSVSGQSYTLHIHDEVLDLGTIKEESELLEWENNLGERLDSTVALLIRLFVGTLTACFSSHNTKQPIVLLTQLHNKLDNIRVDDANLPIVISLERRYQLRRKLETISSKLRHQLRRQAELMSVGKIQEMDPYCLRDYIRRPGTTAAEKAGAKQELMGIQRYQDFNTPENKFLVYFAQILHLHCFQYQRSHAAQYKAEVDKLRLVIDLFKQKPEISLIQNRQYQFTKPNYVLQQNPIYRSFYQAYLEYIQKRYEKEQIWSFRNQLLSDTVYICLTAALLRFEGIELDGLSSIAGSHIPEQGRYIQNGASIKVRIFLQNQVYSFSLSKPYEGLLCDWLLISEVQLLDSTELDIQKSVFPIWVFWYRPNNQALTQLYRYVQDKQYFQKGLVFYLQVPPHHSSPIGESFSRGKLLICQLPNPITAGGFSNTVAFFANVIKSAVESPV